MGSFRVIVISGVGGVLGAVNRGRVPGDYWVFLRERSVGDGGLEKARLSVRVHHFSLERHQVVRGAPQKGSGA